MLIQEAEWLNSEIYVRPSDSVFPLLNVGSSTAVFRTETQPWIHDRVFQPAEARGLGVVHLDLKAAPGVDLVGDIFDPCFRERIREIGVQSILCSNVLEHVTDPALLCDALCELASDGQLIFVTVPFRYPYHADPIDTLFRPTPERLHELFPDCDLVKAE
ncbi:MAG: methyltransferase type 11, partial [Planctomycetaceae bacterium]